MARLGDIGKIITGNTPKTSDKQNYSSNDICFIKPSDLTDKEVTMLTSSEFYISEYARQKARILPPKSILVTCIGIIGKVAINEMECAFNQQINAIIPDRKKCLPEYLAYAIQYKQPEMQNIANAPVVPILNKSQFSDIEIYVPPLHVQRDVIEKLGKVDELIALRKKQLAKLDQLVKSRFIELFGDPLINDKAFPTQEGKALFLFSSGKFLDEKKRMTEGVPVYGGNGIAWYTDVPLIETPTIIVGRVGAYCGNVHMVTEPVWVTDNAIYIKKFKTGKLGLVFLLALMKHMNFSKFADFSGQPKITQKPLETLRYIIPPRELQEQFAAFAEQTDKSKLTIQVSLDKLEVIKKSLMQKYFG